MEENNIMLISLTNICLTLAIALFGCLQWRAVERQNRQNIFSLRIDLYSEINQIIWDILFEFMNIKENINDNSKSASNITLNSLQIHHYLLKIKQLFNEQVAKSVEEFSKSATFYSTGIDKATDGTQLDFVDVFEKSDKVTKVFEEFFSKNKI